MEAQDFIRKWTGATLKERSGAQEHFIDLCRLLGEPTPAEADPEGGRYCFERGARKDSGCDDWADVWKRHCFAWEYKGRHVDLDAAFGQPRQHALALENPPLLIVSDMAQFRLRTKYRQEHGPMGGGQTPPQHAQPQPSVRDDDLSMPFFLWGKSVGYALMDVRKCYGCNGVIEFCPGTRASRPQARTGGLPPKARHMASGRDARVRQDAHAPRVRHHG